MGVTVAESDGAAAASAWAFARAAIAAASSSRDNVLVLRPDPQWQGALRRVVASSRWSFTECTGLATAAVRARGGRQRAAQECGESRGRRRPQRNQCRAQSRKRGGNSRAGIKPASRSRTPMRYRMPSSPRDEIDCRAPDGPPAWRGTRCPGRPAAASADRWRRRRRRCTARGSVPRSPRSPGAARPCARRRRSRLTSPVTPPFRCRACWRGGDRCRAAAGGRVRRR